MYFPLKARLFIWTVTFLHIFSFLSQCHHRTFVSYGETAMSGGRHHDDSVYDVECYSQSDDYLETDRHPTHPKTSTYCTVLGQSRSHQNCLSEDSATCSSNSWTTVAWIHFQSSSHYLRLRRCFCSSNLAFITENFTTLSFTNSTTTKVIAEESIDWVATASPTAYRASTFARPVSPLYCVHNREEP